jgi:hypothetical protein
LCSYAYNLEAVLKDQSDYYILPSYDAITLAVGQQANILADTLTQ